ncbi:hypothetical protein BZA05DRAFT_250502 [Tricharina praecox]|uniref:uncharacterized protein n=1 Tax=Tricharina praecox TaxID=43433 RepID=UPI0022210414|nr:uncharacterized protein BZA05DRAFT_250502 [Tricharina praecox]KAI5854800.1 hypothetical protein BZA05DRAFT_250502 [Tricharina praecox]
MPARPPEMASHRLPLLLPSFLAGCLASVVPLRVRDSTDTLRQSRPTSHHVPTTGILPTIYTRQHSLVGRQHPPRRALSGPAGAEIVHTDGIGDVGVNVSYLLTYIPVIRQWQICTGLNFPTRARAVAVAGRMAHVRGGPFLLL